MSVADMLLFSSSLSFYAQIKDDFCLWQNYRRLIKNWKVWMKKVPLQTWQIAISRVIYSKNKKCLRCWDDFKSVYLRDIIFYWHY